MNISTKRFSEELELYKQTKKYTSVESVIDDCFLLSNHHYNPEDFSRFKSGVRKLKEQDFERFSILFNIRKEYLSGLDEYRTMEDEVNAKKAKRTLLASLHKIFVALGYAGCMMDDFDYNVTFPSNTRVFIEGTKSLSEENGTTILCNVNADELICIQKDEYEAFTAELTDFIEFKLAKLFKTKNSMPIPSAILEDNSTLLHPKTSIHLKDGSVMDIRIKYTPTSKFTDNTLSDSFIIKEQ